MKNNGGRILVRVVRKAWPGDLGQRSLTPRAAVAAQNIKWFMPVEALCKSYKCPNGQWSLLLSLVWGCLSALCLSVLCQQTRFSQLLAHGHSPSPASPLMVPSRGPEAPFNIRDSSLPLRRRQGRATS